MHICINLFSSYNTLPSVVGFGTQFVNCSFMFMHKPMGDGVVDHAIAWGKDPLLNDEIICLLVMHSYDNQLRYLHQLCLLAHLGLHDETYRDVQFVRNAVPGICSHSSSDIVHRTNLSLDSKRQNFNVQIQEEDSNQSDR